MRHITKPILPLLTAAVCLSLATSQSRAANIVIDDFEAGEGHFTTAPSFSGSTQGETETTPGVGPSTADQDLTGGISGSASQRIFLDDDPLVDVPTVTPTQAWRLRHLSGGGTIGNNTPLAVNPNGYVGYYLRTTTPNLQASIMIDDGTTGHLERASFIPIVADGTWNLYQWPFQDPNQWEAFAGTGANGLIDSTTTVTIDALFVVALKTLGDQDAIFNVDYVVTNPDGLITPIPEPATGLLLSLAGLFGCLRRRRR